MEWLASLNIGWVLCFAFGLVFARLALILLRRVIPPRIEAYAGEFCESVLFAWVVVFLFIKPFFYEQFSIPSGSMIPTLGIGDRIVVNKYAYRFEPPRRGDIVVFRSPRAADKNEADFVKRLIGLPGDVIDLRGGKVFINDRKLNEPYLASSQFTRDESEYAGALHFPYRIPKNNYVMLGDNRLASFDSRGWGVIPLERMKGKAVLKLWPPHAFGLLH